jgi:hypothetical protein
MSQTPSSVGRWLEREFKAAWPVFLFFFAGFMFELLIIKLAVERLSVEVSTFSTAIVGALLAAKAVLVIDQTPLERSLQHSRRVIAVAAKTTFYGLATLILGYLERLFEAWHRTGSLDAALRHMIENANEYRMLAWVLGISAIFAAYFALFEISQRMGKGALWSLFFEPPPIADDLVRSSEV